MRVDEGPTSETRHYYSRAAAADQLSIKRPTLNHRVAWVEQDPDALLAPASSDFKPQQILIAETLKDWGHIEIPEPLTFYTRGGVIAFLGLSPQTFTDHLNWEETSADPWLHRTPGRVAVGVDLRSF